MGTTSLIVLPVLRIDVEGTGLEGSLADGCAGRLLRDIRLFVLYFTRRNSMAWEYGRNGQIYQP